MDICHIVVGSFPGQHLQLLELPTSADIKAALNFRGPTGTSFFITPRNQRHCVNLGLSGTRPRLLISMYTRNANTSTVEELIHYRYNRFERSKDRSSSKSENWWRVHDPAGHGALTDSVFYVQNSLNLISVHITIAYIKSDFIQRDKSFRPPPEKHDSINLWYLLALAYGMNDYGHIRFWHPATSLTDFGLDENTRNPMFRSLPDELNCSRIVNE